MGFVPPLTFAEARELVLRTVRKASARPVSETVSLDSSVGRVLATDMRADRPYPPFPRSARDGFAVRVADFPGVVRVIGEVKAGGHFDGMLQPGETVEIMTGAPVPQGADSILMVEHAKRTGDQVSTDRQPQPGEHIVAAGSECAGDAVAVWGGTRIDYGHLASLATVGAACVSVFRKPAVAVIATGDELVPIDSTPQTQQIRNSNSHTLAAQIVRAGGAPVVFPPAPDDYDRTRDAIETALSSADLLLLSGGVSAGKYDLVESVLADFGAEFYFDRVRIQPGQPLVFGRVRDRFFFGLPGNPLSTMVTFELFARAALDIIGGCTETSLPITWARLTAPFRHNSGLTRFLPARLETGNVTHIRWQGSGDVFALARANAFLVAREDREFWNTGESIEVLAR